MALTDYFNPNQVVHPNKEKNIEEITNYLNLFVTTDFETIQEW